MAQTKIYIKTAPALRGQMEMGNEDGFSAVAYRADTALAAGRFVFLKSGDGTRLVQAGATPVVGVVPFVRQYAQDGVTASNEVPAGAFLTPFVMGAIAVENETNDAAAVGMDVYASQTDGHAIFATTAPESGATATGFKVVKVFDAGAKGTMVIIDNRH